MITECILKGCSVDSSFSNTNVKPLKIFLKNNVAGGKALRYSSQNPGLDYIKSVAL